MNILGPIIWTVHITENQGKNPYLHLKAGSTRHGSPHSSGFSIRPQYLVPGLFLVPEQALKCDIIRLYATDWLVS